MNRGKRDKTLKRHPPKRNVPPRILVICEGKVTEPEYLNAFRQKERNPLVEVEIDDTNGDPKTLVERASQRKKG